VLSRRLILLASAVTALVLPAPASAIVNGDPAAQGDYPANGFLGIDSTGDGFVDSFCSGTLVGSRQFLTAARCTTNGLGQARQPSRFTVRIGEIDLPDATVVPNVARNDIPEPNEVPGLGGYVRPTGKNDVAMLTLTAPVDAELVRVIDATETTTWAPGTIARVLGWGEIEGGDPSDVLRTGDVVIRADADCPNANFDASVMLCAAGTPAEGDENPCQSDSGSPLLIPDGDLFALVGVFSGAGCATDASPGIFARVGSDPLNRWVHSKTPEADFTLSHQPRVSEAVRLTQTSRVPTGDPPFTIFRWDLDNDGAFDDDTGASILHTYTQVGEAVAGLEASTTAGDKSVIYYAFDVEPNPNLVPPAQTPTGPGTTTPPPTTNPVGAPLATILNAKRPKVRGGRFPIRIRFAKAAPTGTAVIEVYRGTRRIGIARTKVKRGATKRVRVKLTPTGRRILRRADSKRLKIRVRVRVGSRLLRTKRLTIRR
jgi:secreted trypsin-like serine protease